MGIQASCPPSNLKQASNDGGEQQISKPVVDGLSEVNNYEVQVSWEERILGELYKPVENEKRAVRIIVTGREGT